MTRDESKFDDPHSHGTVRAVWALIILEFIACAGILIACVIHRGEHPAIFARGQQYVGAPLGIVGLVALLLGSLAMVVARWAARRGQRELLQAMPRVALALGVIFLLAKVAEFQCDWKPGLLWGRFQKPAAHNMPDSSPTAGNAAITTERDARIKNTRAFFAVYFGVVGLHSMHIVAALGAVGWAGSRLRYAPFSRRSYSTIRMAGLYWHAGTAMWLWVLVVFYLT